MDSEDATWFIFHFLSANTRQGMTDLAWSLGSKKEAFQCVDNDESGLDGCYFGDDEMPPLEGLDD